MQDLTNEQLIFLDNLIYLNLDFVGVKDEKLTLGEVISRVLKKDESEIILI